MFSGWFIEILLQVNASNLPVLVWIYGGIFVFGNGSRYSPENFMDVGDLIFVSFNYRLGK